MKFKSDSDMWLVINALRSMAEQYEKDSAMFANDGNPRMAQQFGQQTADARRIADQIEEEG